MEPEDSDFRETIVDDLVIRCADGSHHWVFNRLLDPGTVESIAVSGRGVTDGEDVPVSLSFAK